MYKKTPLLAVALLALVASATLLGACHTMAGAGQDISKTGEALEESAEENAP